MVSYVEAKGAQLSTTSSQVYDVPDISCDHCKHAIEAEVGRVAGVTAVEVDVTSKTVAVEGNASGEAVRDAIATAGYDVATKS
jgi:copper chaperone